MIPVVPDGRKETSRTGKVRSAYRHRQSGRSKYAFAADAGLLGACFMSLAVNAVIDEIGGHVVWCRGE